MLFGFLLPRIYISLWNSKCLQFSTLIKFQKSYMSIKYLKIISLIDIEAMQNLLNLSLIVIRMCKLNVVEPCILDISCLSKVLR